MSSITERIVAAGRALTRPGRPPEQPLSRRLGALRDRVPRGAVVADVGTDHAWLPIHLVHDRISPRAIAADRRAPPLQAARARIAAHGLSDRVEVRQGDGLTVLVPGEVGVVTIAGMGGRRIAELVEAVPAVVRGLDRVIVQPNTEVARVRERLRAAGLTLVDEDLLFEDGHWYPTLAWTPGPDPSPAWDDLDLRYGPLLRRRADPALRRFLGDALARVAKALARAHRQGAPTPALAKLQGELADIEHELARLALVAGTISKA